VKIKWLPPLDRLFGPENTVSLPEGTTVAQLLTDLTGKEPDFAPYGGFGPNDRQPFGLLIWRSGQMLTLADELGPEDEVEMIAMVAGG